MRPEPIQKALAAIAEPDESATLGNRMIHGYIAQLEDRVVELDAVIKESIRNHRVGCPCPRCDAVGEVLADPKLIRPTGFLGNINGPGCDPDTH